MATYKVKPGDRAIYPDGTIHTFVEYGVDMASQKKRTLDEVKQLLEQRLDNHSRFADQLASKVFSIESALTSTQSCERENINRLEQRVIKLEQQHCDHGFEIIGGCIAVENRFAPAFNGGEIKPLTIKVRCVHCGLTTDRPLDTKSEPIKTIWSTLLWWRKR